MATLSYYLDRRSVKKDGTSPVKVLVNVRQTNFMISTGIDLLPTQGYQSMVLVSILSVRQ